MTQVQLMFIMWLTDLIIQLAGTLKQVGNMTDEEILAEIPKVEAETKLLMDRVRGHKEESE